ncbi:MAG: hypothetical protein SFV15_10710 [Polyangiaceae bacterium]|nr:hypothetical protein [Polyangiaceae bacterium]
MTLQRLLMGCLLGLIATVPMSAVMLGGKRLLRPGDRGPLPPQQITHEVLERVRAGDPPEHRSMVPVAAVLLAESALTRPLSRLLHFGYGAAMGATYVELCHGLPNTRSGIAFGLGVWTASYCGWLPALRFSSAAKAQSAARNTLMIAAHVTWGAAAGALGRAWRRTL